MSAPIAMGHAIPSHVPSHAPSRAAPSRAVPSRAVPSRAPSRAVPSRAPSRSVTTWDVLAVLSVLAVDYSAKSWASQAGARELDFLLAPTAALVGALTGHPFTAEAGAGYTSRELLVVIAPVCSGTNFAIIAFTSLTCAFITRFPRPLTKLAWLVASAPLAYSATVAANALRITLGLTLGRATADAGWLSASGAHRAVGVGVYLGCLLGLHAFASAAFGRRTGSAAVPLAAYVGVTFLVPLLNGAGHGGAFWTHAAVIAGAAGFAAGVMLCRLTATPSRRDNRSGFLGRSDGCRQERRDPARAVTEPALPLGHVLARLDVPRRGGERPLPGPGNAALVPRPVH